MTDEELKKLEGKPFTKENSKRMIYGGRIDSNGTIVKVMTSKEVKKKVRCSFFSMF